MDGNVSNDADPRREGCADDRTLFRFPTIRDLAAADIEDVNRIWKGLGYYRRAKFLLKAAQKVVEDFDGRLPANVSVMEKDIPGAGRYTAGEFIGCRILTVFN